MRRLESVSRRHDHAEEYACPQCKTTYLVIWEQPGCDNGSAQCEICGDDLLRWQNSFIPIIKRTSQTSGIFAGVGEGLPPADGRISTPRCFDDTDNTGARGNAPARRRRAV